MLNKKAQLEDNLEIILSIIGIIIGVVIITLAKAEYKISLDHAENLVQSGSTIESFDAKFIGTDLLNILKVQTEAYSFGELIAYMPRNYQEVQDPSLFEGILWDKWFVDGLACDTELYNTLNDKLHPIYGKYWQIKAYYQSEEIFSCSPPDILYGLGPIQTNMTVPTLNPQETVFVQLKVYQ